MLLVPNIYDECHALNRVLIFQLLLYLEQKNEECVNEYVFVLVSFTILKIFNKDYNFN